MSGARRRCGYAGPGRRWLFDRHVSLALPNLYQAHARHIVEKYIDLLKLTGIPRTEEIRASSSVPVQPLAGQTTLLLLAALFRRCDVLSSGDPGPMHLAAAQQVPAVALFGPTDERVFSPFGARQVIVRASLPCMRCIRRVCDDNRCMASIRPEKAMEAVLDLAG